MPIQFVDPHHNIPAGTYGTFKSDVWGQQRLRMGVGPQYFGVAPSVSGVLPVDFFSHLLAGQFSGMKLWDRSADGMGGDPFMLRRGFPYPDDFVNGEYRTGGYPQTVTGRYMECWNRVAASPGGGFFDRIYSPLFPPQVDGSVFWQAWNVPYSEPLQVPTEPDNPNSAFWEANAMQNWFLRYTEDDSLFGRGKGWNLEVWRSNSDMGEEIEPDDPGEDPTFIGWNPVRIAHYKPVVPNYERVYSVDSGPQQDLFWTTDDPDVPWFPVIGEVPAEATATRLWYNPASLREHTSGKYLDWTRPQLWFNQLWPSAPSKSPLPPPYPLSIITVPYYP